MNETGLSAQTNQQRKRNIWLGALAGFFLLVGGLWFLYWVFVGRFFIYTEDAYVAGNLVKLTPQVSSGVVAIYADDTDLVEKGQLVVQLDPTEWTIRFNEKKASLAETVRQVAQLFETVKEKEALVLLRRAELRQKKLDLSHRVGLEGTGAISKEEFEQTETDVAVAEASLELAERELAAARILVHDTTVETHPLVKEAVNEIKQAYLALIRCQVLSPARGYVAKRGVQVGDQVLEGETLLTIVPLDYLWVEANYKENQLKDVRIGQPVTFTADIYGRDREYRGKVLGFSAGTGSAFALLPSENASGNWIKIVQRVPIRISIDSEDLVRNPLLIGLSLRVDIDIHEKTGDMLATIPTEKPIYTTPIYDEQLLELESLNPIIEEIIKINQFSR